MRISLVMPTFAHAKLLDKTLGSVLMQNRKPDQIVIVEDGNNDEGATRGVCMNYRGDLPIEYYRRMNRPKVLYSNQAAPFNCAIRRATGDILIMYADDCMFTKPTDIENLVRPVEEDPTVTTYAVVMKLNPAGGDPRIFGDVNAKGEPLFFNQRGQAIRRDIVVAMQGFDESFQHWGGEDNEFSDRLARWTPAIRDQRVFDVVIHHQWHPDGGDMCTIPERKAAEATLARLRAKHGEPNGLVANYGQPWGELG